MNKLVSIIGFRILFLIILIAGLMGYSGCGISDNITISIVPTSAVVAPGQAQEFTAKITGTSNEKVTWSADTGVIDEYDEFIVFIAPDSVGVYTLTATSAADVSKSVTATVTVTDQGVLLAGESDALAKDAVTDLHIKLKSHAEEISIDNTLPSGGEVLKTEILIRFRDTATVGEVNTLLAEINGTIISMIEGLPLMIVRIPDPLTVDALNQIIADVKTEPFVKSVIKSVLAGTNSLPDDLSDIDHIDHQLAVRAHAAWNVRSAIPAELSDRPWLVIADEFGGGEPNDDFNTEIVSSDFTKYKNLTDFHGYHVLGIIAGLFGKREEQADQGRGDVTGIFPERLRVRAYDMLSVELLNLDVDTSPWPRIMMRLGRILSFLKLVYSDAGIRIVINTSLGKDTEFLQFNDAAVRWTEIIRHLKLENQVVHITAAGNTRYGDIETGQWKRPPAAENSPFTYAALGKMTDADGKPIDNLTNTIVVENRVNTAATDKSRPKPGCAHDTSIMGGTLSAIGTDVWSFTFNDERGGADSCTGTSMATPQVAGLAAYVWSLNPDLDALGVKKILEDTARNATTKGPDCNPAKTHQIVIDAYDAVLAAGGDEARLVLFDITGGMVSFEPNKEFDEHDLSTFINVYENSDSTKLEYSREDLNGDGFTGGDSKERFDLDNKGLPRFSNVIQEIEGTDVSYNESELTDLDILCYYAYSPLYTGNPQKRTELLGDVCNVVVETDETCIDGIEIISITNAGKDENKDPTPSDIANADISVSGDVNSLMISWTVPDVYMVAVSGTNTGDMPDSSPYQYSYGITGEMDGKGGRYTINPPVEYGDYGRDNTTKITHDTQEPSPPLTDEPDNKYTVEVTSIQTFLTSELYFSFCSSH